MYLGQTDIYNRQNQGYEAQTTAVGFSVCNPNLMACIAAPVKLTPELNFSCARKNKINDQYSFTLKSWNASNKKITLHLVRHSSATFYARYLNEFQLCQRYGWQLGSKVVARYVREGGINVDETVRRIFQSENKKICSV